MNFTVDRDQLIDVLTGIQGSRSVGTRCPSYPTR